MVSRLSTYVVGALLEPEFDSGLGEGAAAGVDVLLGGSTTGSAAFTGTGATAAGLDGGGAGAAGAGAAGAGCAAA